jgi:hypothetical protein
MVLGGLGRAWVGLGGFSGGIFHGSRPTDHGPGLTVKMSGSKRGMSG